MAVEVDWASLPFFAELEPAGVAAVRRISRVERYRRHTVIFQAGDVADDVFILVSGKVKLIRQARRRTPLRRPARRKPTATATSPACATAQEATTDAIMMRESLLWLMGPGEMFGELSLFDEGHRSTSAVTQTAAVVVRISGRGLRRLVSQRHDVGTAMLRQMSGRLRRSDDRTAGFVMSDVPGRLAHTLMHLAERFGVPTPQGLQVHHDLTQAELAQIVGASRESVNKAIIDFEERGVLRARSRTVVLLDREKLRARMD